MGELISIASRGGHECSIKRTYNSMDDPDKGLFLELVYSDAPVRQVCADIEEAGYLIGPETIWKHRRRGCMSCKREAA